MSNSFFHPDAFGRLLGCLWAVALQLTGAWFLWSSLRGNSSFALGITGGAMTVAAALVLGLQQTGFGRAYTAYAGMLALTALLWNWHYTGTRPDIIDIAGGIMILGGIGIIVLTPRQ